MNKTLVDEHLDLNSFKNPDRVGFSADAKNYFGIEVPEGASFVDASNLGLDD